MMKVCPKCNQRYADASFEFCLNDGTRLIVIPETVDEEPETRFSARPTLTDTAPTASSSVSQTAFSSDWKTIKSQDTIVANTAQFESQNDLSESQQFSGETSGPSSVAQKTLIRLGENKAAAIVAVALALAHNYWQWLYLARPGDFELTTFLVWFLLLASGAAVCVTVLKFSRSGKGYAVIGLIMLAVNLLLYLVPRRL